MGIDVFSRTIALGTKKVENRFVVLPTEGNDANPDGSPSVRTIGRYKKHARGGAGIVITEAVAISPDARARVNQLAMADQGKQDGSGSAGNIGAFANLVREVKSLNPGVLFMIQLDHAGSLADPRFASPVSLFERLGAARVLSDDEIAAIRDRFITCIVRSAEAGFDGVELKFAHGFLCNEMIQSANRRPGIYGGSFGNRMRFFTEIIEGAKSALADATTADRGFIIGIRLSAYEGLPGGFGSDGPHGVIEDISEPRRFVQLAEELGCGFVSVSAGSAAGNLEILLPSKAYAEGCYRHFGWTRALKAAVKIPVIGAGYSHLRDGHNGITGGAPDSMPECPGSFLEEPALPGSHEHSTGQCRLYRVGPAGHSRRRFPEKSPVWQDRRNRLVHDLRRMRHPLGRTEKTSVVCFTISITRISSRRRKSEIHSGEASGSRHGLRETRLPQAVFMRGERSSDRSLPQ